MNKQDLVKAVAAKAGLTKKDTAAALEALMEVVKGAIAKKQQVQLVGFGTFATKQRKARTGRNPQTGAAIKIAAATVPVFRAGKGLKEVLMKKAPATKKAPAKKKK